MNDGEHYSKIDRNVDAQEIVKYQFKDGKKIRTLFKSNEFDIAKITNYTFSNNEKNTFSNRDRENLSLFKQIHILHI